MLTSTAVVYALVPNAGGRPVVAAMAMASAVPVATDCYCQLDHWAVSEGQCEFFYGVGVSHKGVCMQDPCADTGDKCSISFAYFFDSPCDSTPHTGAIGASCGTTPSFVARAGPGNGASVYLECLECLDWSK